MHDLRRTVGSWMAQSGNSWLVIQKALNHASHAATLVYARMAEDPVRNALEAHGERLMRVARGETAEVVGIDG
jgi:integrase